MDQSLILDEYEQDIEDNIENQVSVKYFVLMKKMLQEAAKQHIKNKKIH